MKPPSSDAEALRDEQAAQVRATNGLFVTADELRDLERGQQAIRQSVRSPATSSASGCDRRPQYAPIPGTSSSSSVPPDVAASSTLLDAWFAGLTNRVGMVRREDDRPEAIGSRGGLGKAGFRTGRSTHARIVARPEGDAWRICATHRPSKRPCSSVVS